MQKKNSICYLEITDADIAEAKANGTALITESIVRPEAKQLPTMSINGNEQVVLDIESRAYPVEQRYENPDRIKQITGQRLGADFSFITINGENHPTGYALANIVSVQTSKGIVQMLKVDDVAVDPENRHQSTTGLQILRELFTRATDRGLQGITARARESTMYRLLKSTYVQNIIQKIGYELIDEGIDTTENTGEEPYYRIFIRKRLEEPAVTAQ